MTVKNVRLALAVLVVVAGGACGDKPQSQESTATAREQPMTPVTWEGFTASASGGVEAERYDSFHALAEASDVVVLGRVLEVRPGQVGSPSTSGEVPLFAVVVVGVTEVLRGDPREEVTFELPTVAPTEADVERVISSLNEKKPGGDAIFLLRSKMRLAEEAGMSPAEVDSFDARFRLTNMSSMVANTDSRAVVLLRAEGTDDAVADEVNGLAYADVVATARRASATTPE